MSVAARMGMGAVHMRGTVELIRWLDRGVPTLLCRGLPCLVHCWELVTGRRR